jgi:CHAT domain-containing protein
LPGARQELVALARALGADPDRALYLGDRATKPVVLELNAAGRLARARVIAFATHGLIGGELQGLRQPALVLTPPNETSEADDGLLRLDDILGLRLDGAEWVVLSACNTAAPDGSGEGLSGLTRAFFFAGGPSLLVSHWSVEDRATQALMTEVFRRYAEDPAASRAEALRRGMLALMGAGSGARAHFAHPFAWAAFFLVGESGAGRP